MCQKPWENSKVKVIVGSATIPFASPWELLEIEWGMILAAR